MSDVQDIQNRLARLGIRSPVRKADGTIDTAAMATGQFMNRTASSELIDLTVSDAGWLSAITVKRVDQAAGEIPRSEFVDTVLQPASEGVAAGSPTTPETDNIPYRTTKLRGMAKLTPEAIREAKASGTANLDRRLFSGLAKAIGNDLAKVAMRGNTGLANDNTRLTKLLRTNDGFLTQARASAHRRTKAYGTAFTRSLFPSLRGQLPVQFREDPDLRWLLPSDMDLQFHAELSDEALTAGNSFAGNFASRQRVAPLGIPQLIVPAIPVDQGCAVLSTAAQAAPTSAASSGDGIVFVVTTFLGGYAAANAGRLIRVRHVATGAEEVATVYNDGGAHKILTEGTLNQDSVSTTAAHYLLDFADVASAMLTNPRNLALIVCENARAYAEFDKASESWLMYYYIEPDYLVLNPDALALQDGVIVAPVQF
jgi:hypothetical protein